LETGADDYLTKPFFLRELLARLQAVRRRTIGEEEAQVPVLRFGELELFVEPWKLQKAGRDVHLAPKQFEILTLLMEHQNVPLTPAKILRTIWGPEYGDEPEYVSSLAPTDFSLSIFEALANWVTHDFSTSRRR
jgi:two-component system KDP operon response regulator KdpE